jgi:dihydroorotase
MLLKNGQILMNGKLVKRHIVIEGSRIKKITPTLPRSRRSIDAKGKIIIPGLIDCHVHFREPGFEHKEDFFSGSKAAAAGGVTTVIDMPNNRPPTATIAALEKKRQLAKKSVVNYGFHFGTLGDNIEEIKKAWKSSIASVKVYMDETTGSMMVRDERMLREIFLNSRVVSVHAEDKKAELAIRLAKQSGSRLYLCHLSQKKELDFLKSSRSRNAFAEVTPHHLFLTDRDTSRYNLMKPPLRPQADVEALWHGIGSGIVSTVGTDHAPHTVPEKEMENVYGVPGLETMLPLLLDAVNKGKLSLEQVVRLTSANPSRIFRIRERGEIRRGNFADLTIIDMSLEKEVENAKLFTKCGWSPFNGWRLKGWPVMTMVNGNVVFDNGEIHHFLGEEVQYGK